MSRRKSLRFTIYVSILDDVEKHERVRTIRDERNRTSASSSTRQLGGQTKLIGELANLFERDVRGTEFLEECVVLLDQFLPSLG